MPAARGDRQTLDVIPHVERAAHAIALRLSAQADLHVNQPEAHVLAYLHARRTARIADIHEEFGHRRSTLTSVLDRLEQRGLVSRAVDPADRRSVAVALTPEGTKLARRVFAALRGFETQALRGCSRQDKDGFLRVVNAIAGTG